MMGKGVLLEKLVLTLLRLLELGGQVRVECQFDILLMPNHIIHDVLVIALAMIRELHLVSEDLQGRVAMHIEPLSEPMLLGTVNLCQGDLVINECLRCQSVLRFKFLVMRML
jgi:hypothetical protein